MSTIKRCASSPRVKKNSNGTVAACHCYLQASSCSEKVDVWMTIEDAASFPDSFTLNDDPYCGCYTFNFADTPSMNHGTIYAASDATPCDDCTDFLCCSCCPGKRAPLAWAGTIANLGLLQQVGVCNNGVLGPRFLPTNDWKIVSLPDMTTPRILTATSTDLSATFGTTGNPANFTSCYWRAPIITGGLVVDDFGPSAGQSPHCSNTPTRRTLDLMFAAFFQSCGVFSIVLQSQLFQATGSASAIDKINLFGGDIGWSVLGPQTCGGTISFPSNFTRATVIGQLVSDCEDDGI